MCWHSIVDKILKNLILVEDGIDLFERMMHSRVKKQSEYKNPRERSDRDRKTT